MSLTVKIINKSNNSLPKYETRGSSGLDIKAYIEKDSIIIPSAINKTIDKHNGRMYSNTSGKKNRALIKTGLFLEIPKGLEAQIRPRSGLALKKGVTVLNSPGTIDSDYRGEVGIILINHSTEDITIKNGDRICQIVFNKVESIKWEKCTELKTTKRANKGFGHTGIRNEAV